MEKRTSEREREKPSRRRFLRMAAATIAAVSTEGIAAEAGVGVASAGSGPAAVMRLNPAFRIRRTGNGELEVFTHLPSGDSIAYRFGGCEAALLEELQAGRDRDYLVAALADRCELSVEASAEKVRALLAEFSEAGLVYAGDPITVKIARTHG